MYSAADLTQEIRRIIDDGLARDRAQPASWIVKAVLDRHPFPAAWQGDDRDFAEGCCAAHVRVEVRKKLREYKAGEDDDGATNPAQGRLPGFDYVQRAYLIERAGEPTIVPIGQMTELEGAAKIAELRKMARGAAAHAAELERYFAERAQPAAAE